MKLITIGPDGIHVYDSKQIAQILDAEMTSTIEEHDRTRNGCDCVDPLGEGESCGEKIDDPKAPKGDWTCTRPKGHDGNHRACGVAEHNRCEWEQEEKGFTA